MSLPKLLKSDKPLEHWSDYPDGSVEQAKAICIELYTVFQRVETTAGSWKKAKELAKSHAADKVLGFDEFDELLKEVIGHTEEEADNEVTVRGKKVKARDRKRMGRPPKSNEESPDNYKDLYGTSDSYLAGRLMRDAEEVFQGLKQGEFKSVREAAIKAGIIKPKPTTTVRTDDASKAAKTLLKHYDKHELIEAIQVCETSK